IIDTVHLVEVAQAALVLERTHAIDPATQAGTRNWFDEYLTWLTSSSRGRQERDAKNNHGSCWLLQAAEFAAYAGRLDIRDDCRNRFRTILVPDQIAANGSFPLELARTKPYSYSLFDLDILGINAKILSDQHDDLFAWHTPDGRGLQAAFRFMVPYIENKSSWPDPHDVEYWNDLPVRQPSLLFAGLAYRQPSYLSLWQRLDPQPKIPEVIRNHPVRQPLLWIDPPGESRP
ncbi:MAG: alginate lyase family protein, partial [Acidobacteriaceae bacterium]